MSTEVLSGLSERDRLSNNANDWTKYKLARNISARKVLDAKRSY